MATEVITVDSQLGSDQWTLGAGASKVAAVQSPDDDDSSYINSSTTINLVQRFGFGNPVGIGAGDTINSVTYVVRAKRGGAQNANFNFSAIVGSDTHASTNFTATSAYQDFSTAALTTAPDGGAWTLDDLNTLGPRLRNTQARDVRVTTITAVIDYTPAAGDISGSTAGAATAAGTLAADGALAGVSAGQATPAAIILADGALAGAAAGVATPGAALVGDGALSGASAGVAAASASLLGDGALVGQAAGAAAVSGALSTETTLAGMAAGAATVTGTLSGTGALVGSVEGASTVVGTLNVAGASVSEGDSDVVMHFSAAMRREYVSPWAALNTWLTRVTGGEPRDEAATAAAIERDDWDVMDLTGLPR